MRIVNKRRIIGIKLDLLRFIIFIGLYLTSISWGNAVPLSTLPGINKVNEHRQIVDASQIPWKMIGRVQTDLGGKCTGFLISPSIIVTAAHCLWIKKTGRLIQPQSIHFLWNYQRQNYKAAFLVKHFFVSPYYHGTITGYEDLEKISQDWAYLFISDQSVKKTDLLPIRQNILSVGQAVSLAGYEQDRKEVLYADRQCKITKIVAVSENRFLIFHDCQGTFGSSGAPLLMKEPNQNNWEIIGIQVAAFVNRAGGIAVSIPLQK